MQVLSIHKTVQPGKRDIPIQITAFIYILTQKLEVNAFFIFALFYMEFPDSFCKFARIYLAL